MAFAFDRIMQALDGQQSSNVYGQKNEEGEQGQPGGASALSSSTEGDLSGGGSSGGPSPQVQPKVQTTAGTNQLMQRNRGRGTGPVDADRLKSSVSDARSNIQKEANAYVDSAAQPYQQSQDQIKEDMKTYAESGDTKYLDKMQKAPEYVRPIDLKTSTSIKDVDLLQNDAGIRELFRRGADAEYNVGQAALDAALLRQNQPFQLKRDEILNSYKQLQNEKNDITQNSQERAQKAANEAQANYAKNARGALEGLIGEYEGAVRSKEEAFDRALAEAETSRRAGLDSYAKAALDEIARNNPDISPFLSNGSDPLDAYYQASDFDGSDTNWQDFIDEQDSGRFNRILGALGRGGDAPVPGQYAGKKAADLLNGGFSRDEFTRSALDRAGLARQKKVDADAAEAFRAKAAADAERQANENRLAAEAAAASQEASEGAESAVSQVAEDATGMPSLDQDFAERYQAGIDPVVLPAVQGADQVAKPAWNLVKKMKFGR